MTVLLLSKISHHFKTPANVLNKSFSECRSQSLTPRTSSYQNTGSTAAPKATTEPRETCKPATNANKMKKNLK
jgi:hypothetical protein